MTINTVATIGLSVMAMATLAIYTVAYIRVSRKECKNVDKVERMEMPRLKSCPFCGGEAKLHTFIAYECACYIKCQTCQAKTRNVIDENQDGKYILNAIEIWNIRKDTKE